MLITTVITTNNRPESVKNAIKSVLAQTYRPIEIIVVEDGSICGIDKWIVDNGYNHIKYIRHEANKGLPVARNTGLKYALGEYVAFMDDDDLWDVSKIEHQVNLLSKIKASKTICYCGCKTIDANNNITSINAPSIQGKIRNAIVNPGLKTIPSSSILNTKELNEIGGFDTDLKTGIDHDFWMKLAKHNFSAEYINKPLVLAKQGDGQMTKDVNKRIVGIKKYLDKWRPELVKWYGVTVADRYIKKYYLCVIGNLGVEVYQGDDNSRSKKCFNATMKYSKVYFIFSKYFVAHIFGVECFKYLVRLKKKLAL